MTEDKKTSKSVSIHNRKSAAPGDVIVRQGEKGNQAFLIQSGRVKVIAERDGKTIKLAELGPGQIFGEMALVGDEVRSATVEALENTMLIVITRPVVIEKLARTDPTIRALVPMLMDRLKQSNNTVLVQAGSVEALTDTAQAIYDNLQSGLDPQRRASMDKALGEKLQEFLKAARDFRKTYGVE